MVFMISLWSHSQFVPHTLHIIPAEGSKCRFRFVQPQIRCNMTSLRCKTGVYIIHLEKYAAKYESLMKMLTPKIPESSIFCMHASCHTLKCRHFAVKWLSIIMLYNQYVLIYVAIEKSSYCTDTLKKGTRLLGHFVFVIDQNFYFMW